MVDRYQRAALNTRLHIPLLYGIDVRGRQDVYVAGSNADNIGNQAAGRGHRH